MTILETLDVLMKDNPYSVSRDTLSTLLRGFGWWFVHDEPGRYDPPPPYQHGNGFLVFQDPSGQHWAFYFQDDSYNDGWLENYAKVTPIEKTITEWQQ